MGQRFSNPEFFGTLGKPLLVTLLQQFTSDFVSQGVTLPDPDADEKEFFKAVAALGASKQGFPPKLHDILYGIVTLGNEAGKDRLIHAATVQPDLLDGISQNATCEEFALHFYLASADLFEKKVHETQILARSSFQVFGSSEPIPPGTAFPTPTEDQLARFKADIDQWVAETYRGQERATQIEYYEMQDEHMLLIRIGDSHTRHAVVRDDDFVYEHFRPARDLVITFCPTRDEVRINGKGAKRIRMLRETFGRRFFGDPDRFSVQDPFTLAPLVRLGSAALEVTPGQGIERIVLTELLQETDGDPAVKMHLKGPDLFEFSEREHMRLLWPKARLIGAGFDVHFTGQTIPRQFYLREGNGLRQVRNSDAAALYRWMTDVGFRKTKAGEGPSDECVEPD